MDWIRRNLFFNNKKSEKNKKDVVFDDEFIDIIEEESSKQQSVSVSIVESPLESPTASASESQEEKPVIKVKKVARKPLNHQIICLSEAAPDHDINDIEPIQFVPSQKPKNSKKKLLNNQKQENTQLRNNIIHQPR